MDFKNWGCLYRINNLNHRLSIGFLHAITLVLAKLCNRQSKLHGDEQHNRRQKRAFLKDSFRLLARERESSRDENNSAIEGGTGKISQFNDIILHSNDYRRSGLLAARVATRCP